MEDVWSIVAKQIARCRTSVTAIDKLWHVNEAAWVAATVHTIQSLYDSLPKHITVVIAASGSMHPNFLQIYSVVIFNTMYLFNKYYFVICISS